MENRPGQGPASSQRPLPPSNTPRREWGGGGGQSHADLVFRDPNLRQAPGWEGAIAALLQLAPPSKAPKVQPHAARLHTERFLNIRTLRGWLPTFPKMQRVGAVGFRASRVAWIQQPHVNMSFRPAKPTGKQALAEGQEERPRPGTLFQIWDSEDVAFRSLNLAPKAVPAFGKKSQFCVRPWSCLSLLPALTPGRGTLCDLVLRGPLLPPASPAISFPPLGPVPAPGHSQSLPARRPLPVL